MTLYPKEFGPHSPEALGKLKTAVATTPGAHSLSVSVPGATGHKSGAFQRVTAQPPGVQAELQDTVYGVAGQKTSEAAEQVFLGDNLRRGKGFKAHEDKGEYGVWASHTGRGVYSGVGSVVRAKQTYEITYDIADGFGGVVPGSISAVTASRYGNTLYLGRGPKFKPGRLAFHATPLAPSGHVTSIDLLSSANNNFGSIEQPQEYDGTDRRQYTPVGLAWAEMVCFDTSRQARVTILRGIEGERDAWNLPKMAYEVVTLTPGKAALRGEDAPKHIPGMVHAFKPPKVPGAGASHVFAAPPTALGGSRIGCVVGVYPYAHRTMPPYSTVDMHFGKLRDQVFSLESWATFKNSKPQLYFAVSADYGASWDFQPLTVFDRPVPVWEGHGVGGWGPADYATEQPLIGWATYRTEGVGAFNEALGRFDTYDLLFATPDRAGSWDSRCVARLDSVVSMSHVVALSPSIWVLVLPMLDDRPYNNDASQYVRFRCVALRTMDAGATWREVSTPFSDLTGAGAPADRDRGYALKATVLRDGCAVLKFYRAKHRIGDPASVRDAPRTVRLAVTRDYGYTWQEVVPQGLPSLDPDKLGSLLVTKATATTSVVAVTAWDCAASAYAVYISKDDCATWMRGATVAEGAHVGMDEVLGVTSDGSSSSRQNFAFLRPLLDPYGSPAVTNVGAPWAHDASKRIPRGPE